MKSLGAQQRRRLTRPPNPRVSFRSLARQFRLIFFHARCIRSQIQLSLLLSAKPVYGLSMRRQRPGLIQRL